jgi:hypothetical protein
MEPTITDGFKAFLPDEPRVLFTHQTLTTARRIDKSESKTALPGYVNRNCQRVIRATDLPGNDHLQKIYVLRCEDCGSEVWRERIGYFPEMLPEVSAGRPGLPFNVINSTKPAQQGQFNNARSVLSLDCSATRKK